VGAVFVIVVVPVVMSVVMSVVMVRMRMAAAAQGRPEHAEPDQQDRAITEDPQSIHLIHRRGEALRQDEMDDGDDDDGTEDMAQGDPARHGDAAQRMRLATEEVADDHRLAVAWPSAWNTP